VLTLKSGVIIKSSLKLYQDEVKIMVVSHHWMTLLEKIKIHMNIVQDGALMQ
jgi:hypothetical protein